MSPDNITLLNDNNISRQAQSITLHGVLGSMEAWRTNKKTRNERIPPEIWDNIFFVLKTVPESRILAALGITKDQLNGERQERSRLATSTIEKPKANKIHEASAPSAEFCETKPTFPLEYKPAKAFSTNTCVVELYRPDGMLMKIHICTDKFEDLLRAFFSGDTTC